MPQIIAHGCMEGRSYLVLEYLALSSRGNHGYLADGTPVIFDPTAYYGDRECDLAMTELFGGSYVRQAAQMMSGLLAHT